MSPRLQRFGLDALSAEDRLAIAEELWDSVVTELEAEPLTESQRGELERRLAAADADPASGIPWETVQKEALRRWQR
jgi:putative addiction module component (TIGR02574 family)